MNIEQFINALHDKGISLSDYQLKQFEIYYNTLVEWNEKMNLIDNQIKIGRAHV